LVVTLFCFGCSFESLELKDICFLFLLKCQENNEKQYAKDNFWLQTLSFKQRVDAGSFSSLYEVRDLVYSIHNLALMNNMKKKVKDLWLDRTNTINYMITSMNNQVYDHDYAMQMLKDYFGSKSLLSKKSKRFADRVVRESVRRQQGLNVAPPVFAQYARGPVMTAMAPVNMQPPPIVPPMGQMPMPFHISPNHFQGSNSGQRPLGPCFTCQQLGHMAKDCPMGPRLPKQNFGAKRGGPKRFGKKKN